MTPEKTQIGIHNIFQPGILKTKWFCGGVTLSLVFAWMLAYPFYGPLFNVTAGSPSTVLNHTFIITHAASYLVLPLASSWFREKETAASIGLASGIAIFISGGLTIIASSTAIKIVLMAVCGLGAGILILLWVPGYLESSNPSYEIGLAMVLCNLLLAGFPIVVNTPENTLKIMAAVLGLGPLLAGILIRKAYLAAQGPCQDRQSIDESRRVTGSGSGSGLFFLVLLALVEYFCGGLWYRVIVPSFYLNWPSLGGLEPIIYAVQAAVCAFWARKGDYLKLAVASVSLLGTGLVLFATGQGSIVVLGATILLAVGLGSVDLFYWLALRDIAVERNSPYIFGLGMGTSLIFISLPGVVIDLGIVKTTAASPVVVLTGAALLFLAVPLISSLGLSPSELRKHNMETAHDTSTETDAGIAGEPSSLPYVANLTPQEKRVYECLLHGMTDKQMAERLTISINTVKFHTRNILRKAGAANRIELLAGVLDSHSANSDSVYSNRVDSLNAVSDGADLHSSDSHGKNLHSTDSQTDEASKASRQNRN